MTLIDPSFLTSLGEWVGGLWISAREHYPYMAVYPVYGEGWTCSDCYNGEKRQVVAGDVKGVYSNRIARERMATLLAERGIPIQFEMLKDAWLPKLWDCYRQGDFFQKQVFLLQSSIPATDSLSFPWHTFYCFSPIGKLGSVNTIHVGKKCGAEWGPDSDTKIYIGEP